MKSIAILFMALVVAVVSPAVASAVSTVTVDWNPANPLVVGLNAEATFTVIDATHLDVLLTNTSTAQPLILAGCPNGTTCPSSNASNQLLTGLGFDLPGALAIAGGSAIIGTGSISQNFDPSGPAPPISLSGGANVSVEWGYANGVTFTASLFPLSGTETLANYFAAMAAQTTPFHAIDGTHPNLDGPSILDGPQAGLVANPNLYSLGGLGAIRNSALLHLTLAGGTLPNLDSFDTNTVRFEFGSALIFGTPTPPTHPVPEPASLLLLGSGLAGLAIWGRRKAA